MHRRIILSFAKQLYIIPYCNKRILIDDPRLKKLSKV